MGNGRLLAETTLSLRDAAKELPRRKAGRKTHIASLYRWSQKGLLGPHGRRVHLETIRVGGVVCTSREALARFFDALSAHEMPAPANPKRPSDPYRLDDGPSKILKKEGVL